MSVWFEGSNEIKCNIQLVQQALEDFAAYNVGVVRLMPGLTSVELVEHGSDYVTIKTNEGIMKRKNISKRVEAERVALEFDEEYKARLIGTVKAHYFDEFTATAAGVKHRAVLSGVEAHGFLGFFYRNFGKSSIGNAVLNSNRMYFEKQFEGVA